MIIFCLLFYCRAIEESLLTSYGVAKPPSNASTEINNADLISFHEEDKELLTALSLSLKEQTERDKNTKLEDEMLQQALRISITDK